MRDSVCSLLLLAPAPTPPRRRTPAAPRAGSTPTSPATPAPAAPTLHCSGHRPTSNITYKGPVYVKTATGEVVPYSRADGRDRHRPSATASARPAEAPVEPPIGSANGPTKPELLVPGTTARYVNGLAAAPMSAPAAVQQIIWAGNELIGLPYIYGGGHGSFISSGYDCSGTVSFALHGATLLKTPEDSSEFEHCGSHGIGRWIAIFSNPGHAYMTVAGLRLDTSAADDPSNQQGPRWRPLRPSNGGFVVRHPLGL